MLNRTEQLLKIVQDANVYAGQYDNRLEHEVLESGLVKVILVVNRDDETQMGSAILNLVQAVVVRGEQTAMLSVLLLGSQYNDDVLVTPEGRHLYRLMSC